MTHTIHSAYHVPPHPRPWRQVRAAFTARRNMIDTAEQRDALPIGTLAQWQRRDHPDVTDELIPPQQREFCFIPDQIMLRRTEAGWVDLADPKNVHRTDTLPPLPWRLLMPGTTATGSDLA